MTDEEPTCVRLVEDSCNSIGRHLSDSWDRRATGHTSKAAHHPHKPLLVSSRRQHRQR